MIKGENRIVSKSSRRPVSGLSWKIHAAIATLLLSLVITSRKSGLCIWFLIWSAIKNFRLVKHFSSSKPHLKIPLFTMWISGNPTKRRPGSLGDQYESTAKRDCVSAILLGLLHSRIALILSSFKPVEFVVVSKTCPRNWNFWVKNEHFANPTFQPAFSRAKSAAWIHNKCSSFWSNDESLPLLLLPISYFGTYAHQVNTS